MSRNQKSWTEIFAQIETPLHCVENFDFNTEEAAAFDADPDVWAANYFGVTVEQYHEWCDCDGRPLCSATTKSGKPCGQIVAGFGQLDARDFVTMHRAHRCRVHNSPSAQATSPAAAGKQDGDQAA
jgi:hypothetical protein